MSTALRDRFIDTSRGRFHVLDWHDAGQREQPVVVLQHGFAQTAHSFDEYAESLGEHGVRVISIDARGHGLSEWASDGDYSRAVMVQDMVDLLEALGLASVAAPEAGPPLAIVGMSMSAAISSALVATHAAWLRRLQALVLIDWAPWEQSGASVGAMQIAALFQLSWPSFEEAVQATIRFNPRRSPENIRARLQHSLREHEGRWVWATDPAIMRSMFESPEPAELMWALVRRIEVPTMVVRGGESNILSRPQAERLASELPQGRLVEIAGAGHSVAGDKPVEFAAEVTPFLLERLRG